MKRIARVFLGRGRSWQNPVMSVEQTDGYVLDPVFAIKRRFSLEPRQQRQITFITVAAESRDDLMRLIAKYRDPDICSRTFELAWSHAQLEYRYLDIQGDAAFRFAELASHLLYPNIRLAGAGGASAPECAGTVEAVGLWHLGRFAARSRFGCRFAGAWLWCANYWLPTPTGGCAASRPTW